MSAISSIGSCSQPSYLQQLQEKKNGPDSARGKAVTDALQALGVDPSKAASIESQIQQAVQDAAGSTGATGDRRTAVQQAIDGVLKDNGIDPAQFKTQLQTSLQKTGAGKHRHHHAKTPSTTTADTLNSTAVGSASGTSKFLNTVA